MLRPARHWRFSWWSLPLLIVVGGCSHDTPVAPSSAPAQTIPAPPAAPPFEVYSRALSGRVLDENGLPIPNATVIAFGGDGNSCCGKPMPPVSTDGNGVYQTVVTALKPPFHYFGTDVTITADGFERTLGWDAGTGDTVQDFRLFRPLSIAAGVDTQLTLDANNSLCGLEDEFRCRPIHISAASGASSVTVETTTSDPANPVWLIVGGPTAVQYPFAGKTRVSVPVVSGSVSTVQVLRPWTTAPQMFVLRTTVN
jgi:hypothetical protein